MIFAFDYDGTLKGSAGHDRDECLMWTQIFDTLTDRGHEVIIATLRTGSDADRADVEKWLKMAGYNHIPVVYCGGRGLKDEVCRAEGYRVDIWIDDMPDTIRQSVPMIGAAAVQGDQHVAFG